MKRFTCLFTLILVLSLIFCGCTPAPAAPEPVSPQPTPPADPPSTNENENNSHTDEGDVFVTDIVFEEGHARTQATITAYNKAGEEVWNYITPVYEATELARVNEIGQKDGVYYFVEGGTIVALDVQTGALIWSNAEFDGASVTAAFGDSGIYLCGYYYPDFFAVGYDGTTLAQIGQFDQNYFWPDAIDLIDNCAAVTLTGSMDGDSNTQKVFYVDLTTYEVSETMP